MQYMVNLNSFVILKGAFDKRNEQNVAHKNYDHALVLVNIVCYSYIVQRAIYGLNSNNSSVTLITHERCLSYAISSLLCFFRSTLLVNLTGKLRP
jgi:hypothetical protein